MFPNENLCSYRGKVFFFVSILMVHESFYNFCNQKHGKIGFYKNMFTSNNIHLSKDENFCFFFI